MLGIIRMGSNISALVSIGIRERLPASTVAMTSAIVSFSRTLIALRAFSKAASKPPFARAVYSAFLAGLMVIPSAVRSRSNFSKNSSLPASTAPAKSKFAFSDLFAA